MTLITAADSSIGRAIATVAHEDADVIVSYLGEHEDARETARWIEKARREAILIAGHISDETHCRFLVQRAIDQFGQLNILVNNATHQVTFDDIQEISSKEWDGTFRTNVDAMFYLCKAALRLMKPGASIINTSSLNATDPSSSLLAYATIKGAIANFTAGLAGLVASIGIRVNSVAPGPIWTPSVIVGTEAVTAQLMDRLVRKFHERSTHVGWLKVVYLAGERQVRNGGGGITRSVRVRRW